MLLPLELRAASLAYSFEKRPGFQKYEDHKPLVPRPFRSNAEVHFCSKRSNLLYHQAMHDNKLEILRH